MRNMAHGVGRYTVGCRCDDCTKAMRDYKREWVDKHRAAGLCTRCTAKAEPNRTVCFVHLQKDTAYRKKKAQRGVAA